MSELLVFRKQEWLGYNIINGYKKGETIEVYENGKCTQKLPKVSPYWKIRLPNMSYKRARVLLRPVRDPEDPTRILKRRKYRIIKRRLPDWVRKSLRKNNQATIHTNFLFIKSIKMEV